MNPADLQIRIAKKLVNGRGGMTITQADLDVLLNCGAYEKLCQAAIEFNQCRKRNAPSRSTSAETSGFTAEPTELISKSSGMIPKAAVNEAYQRAQAALKKPARPLTADTLKAKAHNIATPADAPLKQGRAG